MIPYAQDINRRDMLAYWSDGYLLVDEDGQWNAYKLYNIDGDEVCTITRCNEFSSDGAREMITLSKEKFFESVLLHRPPLGTVITPEGEALHLSWVAATGNKIKSVMAEDIHVTKLKADDAPEEDVDMQQLINQWARTVRQHRKGEDRIGQFEMAEAYPNPKHMYYINRMNAPRMARRRREPARDDIIKLVLAYLNRTPLGFYEALEIALHDGMAVDENDVLIRRTDKKAAELSIGDMMLGTVCVTPMGCDFKAATYKNTAKAKVAGRLLKYLTPPQGEAA